MEHLDAPEGLRIQILERAVKEVELIDPVRIKELLADLHILSIDLTHEELLFENVLLPCRRIWDSRGEADHELVEEDDGEVAMAICRIQKGDRRICEDRGIGLLKLVDHMKNKGGWREDLAIYLLFHLLENKMLANKGESFLGAVNT